MSSIIATIDLSSASQPYILTIPSSLQLNQIGWLEFLNESPYKVIFSGGGVNIPITAWQDYPLQVSKNNVILQGLSFPLMLNWTLLTNVDNVPTILEVVLYFRGETPSATSPVALTRQVASTVVNAVAVTNTGFAAGTIFISGTPVGDDTAATIIDNAGNETLGSHQENGSLTVKGRDLNSIIVTNDSVTAEDSNGHALAILSQTGLQTQDTGGNVNFTASPGGDVSMVGDLSFIVGSLSRVSKFTGSFASATTTTFAHGLGVIPDIILITITGSTTTQQMVKYNSATMTTTNADLTSDAACSFVALAIKF